MHVDVAALVSYWAHVLLEDLQQFLDDNELPLDIAQGLPPDIWYWCEMAGLRIPCFSAQGVPSCYSSVLHCVGGLGIDSIKVLRHNKHLFQLAIKFSQYVSSLNISHDGRTANVFQILREDACFRKELSRDGGIRCFYDDDPKHWGPCEVSGYWYFDPGNVVYAFVLRMVIKFCSRHAVWTHYVSDVQDEEKLGDFCEALLGLFYRDQRDYRLGVYDPACVTLEQLVRAAGQMLMDCRLWNDMRKGQSLAVLDKYGMILQHCTTLLSPASNSHLHTLCKGPLA